MTNYKMGSVLAYCLATFIGQVNGALLREGRAYPFWFPAIVSLVLLFLGLRVFMLVLPADPGSRA